jgi:hypothetical protein
LSGKLGRQYKTSYAHRISCFPGSDAELPHPA